MSKALCIRLAVFLSVFLSAPLHAGYTETRYPIVLVHGWLGFDEILGYDYWYGIPRALERDGAVVYAVRLAPYTDRTGRILEAQVEEILAISGAQKVNLIGHNHGVRVARMLAGTRPELIASVTSVGGRVEPDGLIETGAEALTLANTSTLPSALVEILTGWESLSGYGWDIPRWFVEHSELTTNHAFDLRDAEMASFSERFPAGLPTQVCGEGEALVDGVAYYSWGGVSVRTNPLDASDYLLAATSEAFGDVENDGFTTRCSSHLGQVIKDDYRMNNLDLINQVLGLRNYFAGSPLTAFRQHANRLRQAGL